VHEIEDKVNRIEHDIEYFDKMVTGAERLIKPWKIAVLALIIGWVLTIGGFIWLWAQYDYEATTETITQETSDTGVNNYNNNSIGGDLTNGKADD